MKTALIMGISGGFAGHVAQSLARNGWKIKTMMRNPEKLPEQFKGTEVIKGEVASPSDVRKATEAVGVIVYGVNPANYAWQGVALPLLENVAKVAEEKALTIVFPGNVYIYNPEEGPEFTEQSASHPPTSKGMIRRDMEKRLKQAAENGAKVITLRMGDFIGKAAKSTWLQQMIKPSKKGYVLTATGTHDLKHSWANLPDAANTVTKLLTLNETLPAYSEFNFKGYQMSIDEIATAIKQATDKPV
ncbi:MAG: NAD(P)H-binding protein, partial [Gammaproteobacteria bacterium]|nr:NAD(P)H-binding protein [Gammaproteobacteria bacterium]